MNAKQMELARRFVACKGWVWIEGMQISDGCAPLRICALDGACALAMGSAPWPMVVSTAGANPDLSDALTRAGLLEVVRRAWGCHVWTAPYVQWTPDGDVHWFMAEVPVAAYYDAGWARFNGPSELHALLAALEAATGV